LFFICLVDGDSCAKSEDLYHIKRFNHGNVYVNLTLAGLIMDSYIPREGWDPVNRVNHGSAYVRRELVSH
jgi:hypothetical protein